MTMTKEFLAHAGHVHYFTGKDRSRGGQVRAEGLRLRAQVKADLKARRMRPSQLRPLIFEQHYRYLTVHDLVKAMSTPKQYQFQFNNLNHYLKTKLTPKMYLRDCGPRQWSVIIARWG